MAAIFLLAVWIPALQTARNMADSRMIMLLEGVSILGVALAGVYLRIALVFFPVFIISLLGLTIYCGLAAVTWSMVSFAGYISLGFINGILAHRGFYGPARTNPDHPHRRYDRMLLVYIVSGAVMVILWGSGIPVRWSHWSAFYFSLLFVADGFLQNFFDRIPQGFLRWFRSRSSDEIKSKIGMCLSCVHVQPAIPVRKHKLIRCGLSSTDNRFQEYPKTPVLTCPGFSSSQEIL